MDNFISYHSSVKITRGPYAGKIGIYCGRHPAMIADGYTARCIIDGNPVWIEYDFLEKCSRAGD